VVAAPATIFGRIITGGDVERWALALTRKWFSTYLAESERQHGIVAGTLPRPRAIVLGPSFDKWPEDQVPAVIVTSPGTADLPWRDGDGLYRARWTLEPGVLCSARTQAESHDLAALYGGALELLFLQRPSLDGYANGVAWLGIRYDDLGYDDTRSLYAARVQLVVEVADVAQSLAGPTTPDEPLDPDTDPWPAWPLVQTVELDVEKVAELSNPLPEEVPE